MGMDAKGGFGREIGSYEKPKVLSREAIDKASVCNSAWVPGQPCRLVRQMGCRKTKF